jgi:hypothetical protein
MKIIARCWSCDKDHDITKWVAENGQKCECGGCVTTPSGKVQFRIESTEGKK